MDLSLKKNLNQQNKKYPTKIIFTPVTTSYFSPAYSQHFMSSFYLPKTDSRSLPVIKPKIKDIDMPSNNRPDPVSSMAHTSNNTSTNYQSMSNLHSILYLSMTASDSLVEKPKSKEDGTPTYIKLPDIVYPTTTTSHFASSNYQSMSNSYLSGIPSESLGVEKPKIRDVETPTYINSPNIVYPMTTTSHFASSNYQSMSNSYLSRIPSESFGVEKPKIKDVETPTYINSPDIVYPTTTTSHFASSNYQSMSNLYLSGIPSESLGVEKPKIKDVESPTCITHIKPPDTVTPTVTTSNYSSSNYRSMSNLYLSGIPSESLGVENPKIKNVESPTCITYIKPPDTVTPTVTTSNYSSSNYRSMSNLYLSGIPSESLGVEKPKIKDVESLTCITYIKPPDTVTPTVTTSNYSSSNYQSMSNLYLSGIPSESLGVEKPKIKDVESLTCITYIKPPDTVTPTVTTSHYSSSNYQSMSNSPSNLYSSAIPSESSEVKKPNIKDFDAPAYVKIADSFYPMVTTSDYTSSSYSRRISNLYLLMTNPQSLGIEKPKFRLIKTINEANPFDSFFLPAETTSHSPSTNDQGISPKVIDYVLKCKKSVADQSFVNKQEADSSMCAINKNDSVNYDTTSENNQMPLEVPSIPNMKKRQKQPNILLKSDREIKKCIPSIPTSRLQPINKRMYEESLKIFNFSKTNRQIESTSNNEQNDCPQISYPAIQPSKSVDEKYSSGILHTQLKPHPTDMEIPEKSEMINLPYYDTSSLQVTNEAESYPSFILKNAQEMKHLKPPNVIYIDNIPLPV